MNKIQKGIFELPDSFAIKASFAPLNRPNLTLINYDHQKLISWR